jgi:hypothetical protein
VCPKGVMEKHGENQTSIKIENTKTRLLDGPPTPASASVLSSGFANQRITPLPLRRSHFLHVNATGNSWQRVPAADNESNVMVTVALHAKWCTLVQNAQAGDRCNTRGVALWTTLVLAGGVPVAAGLSQRWWGTAVALATVAQTLQEVVPD